MKILSATKILTDLYILVLTVCASVQKRILFSLCSATDPTVC